ncbi:hydroxyectoine utilization dehydratase EutB [Zobellella denitrificans]|jgi:threonine dehydratase|uniref:Threonine dehydratase n=1 Tax=Zobellella denitrificans TaxID=347534 RepID=A0A231N204_9GAMM|nr:hydroxyectoine utilization dehydratase EutB [Zobellella denitrificans]ATG72827.1 threonine dehydratase [Zobellella denitrificans]OXS16477.1 hydroxyectoine utilization dehydratase EutB [Zobellella denitrificans]
MPATDVLPDLSRIYRARQALQGQVARTPLIRSEALSRRFACEAWLKLETLQPIGAFKLRGATFAMSRLGPEQRQAGVVTCSTGNHGRAIAYAGQRLGIHTVICMSRLVPANKVEAIRALGAEVRIIGNSQDEAEVEALRLVEEQGMVYLPPFDHPDIITGQGTIGLEILEDLPTVDTVFAGLSGGGLVGGIGIALKGIKPTVELVGVTMDRGAAMVASLEAGQPVQVTEYESFADSLGGGIGLHNRYSFEAVRRHMDRAYLVSEAAIASAMVHFVEHEKMLVEGAAVVGVAAIEQHSLDVRGKQVVFVVSGHNVALDTFDRARALAAASR